MKRSDVYSSPFSPVKSDDDDDDGGDDDDGNDDDDDDCLHFLEGLAHIWLVTQTPLTDTAPLAQYHHPRHHSNIHHRHPRHPCLTD